MTSGVTPFACCCRGQTLVIFKAWHLKQFNYSEVNAVGITYTAFQTSSCYLMCLSETILTCFQGDVALIIAVSHVVDLKHKSSLNAIYKKYKQL